MSDRVSRRNLLCAAAGAATGGLAMQPARAGAASPIARDWIAGPLSLSPNGEPAVARALAVFRPSLIFNTPRVTARNGNLQILDVTGAAIAPIPLQEAPGNSGLAVEVVDIHSFGDGSVRFVSRGVSGPPVWSSNGFRGLLLRSEETPRSPQFLAGSLLFPDGSGNDGSLQAAPFFPRLGGSVEASRQAHGWIVFAPEADPTEISILLPVTSRVPVRLSSIALLNSRGDYVLEPYPLDPDATGQRSMIRTLTVTFDATVSVRTDLGEELPLAGAPEPDGLLIAHLLPAIQKVRDDPAPVQAATVKKKGGGGMFLMSVGYQF